MKSKQQELRFLKITAIPLQGFSEPLAKLHTKTLLRLATLYSEVQRIIKILKLG